MPEWKYPLTGQEREGECRSCVARIFWIKTTKGKWMPVNPDGTSHFSTCPNAKQHRGGRAGSRPERNKGNHRQPENLAARVDALVKTVGELRKRVETLEEANRCLEQAHEELAAIVVP